MVPLFPILFYLMVVAAHPAALPLQVGARSAVNRTSLPQYDSNPAARAQAIVVKREGYLYGPSLMGNASFSPTGTLGDALVIHDIGLFAADEGLLNTEIQSDLQLAEVAVAANGGLNSLTDYANVLYNGQWKTSVPGGEDPGILSNYTQDLLFSMERLSLNPYALKRLASTPISKLPFTVNDTIVLKITGRTLEELQHSGSLFIVDHSYQAKYPKTSRFGAACSAYFFIHPESGDFLPLAIKTNVGSNLVYTPLDTPNDWLLAKMMFNVNDLFHAQIYHLVATHDVGEIVLEAALRTLSDSHPILAILRRLMYQAYALRPIGAQILFNSGGAIDQFFYVNSTGAQDFVADFYPIAGSFQGNYLEVDLQSRGLLDPISGPRLKSFPFYSDARTIRNIIAAFMTSFVNSYYVSDEVVTHDNEVQDWFTEATKAALVIDFPASPSKARLIEVLTHFAFLTGVAHHALNTGDPVASLATLPFHPAALYAPIPTAKGVANLLPFLPPVPQALGQISLFAGFNRPRLAATNRTLEYAFSDPSLLSVLNSQTATATSKFLASMQRFSAQVQGRTFGKDGLSCGMPFLWKGLDPGTIPFYFAV